ncbi:hypothetical protein GCM10027515_10330 [Schumannella luteola]|uniref:Sodium:proton antiporter n=1 Tax=Schumannella luteola TaxID=472059 RepID=A0A852Y6I1_9MICO|nr:DUF6328 family protein [Schumannella luteola]NYG97482.1 hypothetical protein [Schumannella luteola]TPX05899.1 sodium:proton antiporter [Schumannella luteola]
MDAHERPVDGHPEDAVADGRPETENQRFDRNWGELLQELRVTQTGTQILTGFLLTLAFQPRFAELDDYQRTLYLVLVAVAVLATILALAPVGLHRALFRHQVKGRIVRVTDQLLRVTLVAVALVLTGTASLMADVVLGRAAGLVAGAVALVIIALLWLALPLSARRAARRLPESPTR